ncbi:hypothetical protein [Pontivivens nitratireducens]|uniref:hypothetical protein n=1 Tax=Pontivivens nitratireducens TaxID=2758038 RepID=UPI00163AAC7B|nr:hypothetical protein [Pontibrevibacter nitratireducens]
MIDRDTAMTAAPFAAAIGLVAAGFALTRWKPGALDMPEPNATPRLPDFRDGGDIVRQLREGAAALSPRNLTDTLGRSLIISGALLLMVRAIDGLDKKGAKR